jgi:hypothetical protein
MAIKSITPPSLNAFANQEFLRSSQFLLLMPINGFISPELSRDIGMFCESIEFPGMNAATTDYRMAGMNRIKVPYSKDFQDVTLTLIHNTNYEIYHNFVRWVRYAGGGDSILNNSTSVPYYDEFTSNFKLLHLRDVADQNKRFGGLSSILSNIDKFNAKVLNSEELFNSTRIGQSFVSNFNAVTRDSDPRQIYYNVEFYNSYPTAVQTIPMNWAEDNFQRITVTFTYEYYVINPFDDF